MPTPQQVAAVEGLRRLFISVYIVASLATHAVALYHAPAYWSQPYHTSALSGAAWLEELLEGHPDRIYTELGVRLHVFVCLLGELVRMGHMDSRNGVTLKEQLAIFLYTCVTGLSSRHTGERFQRSTDTIARYFKRMLDAFSSPEFYNKFVRLPTADEPISPYILRNSKLYPYFQKCLGALDGTHIACSPSAEDRSNMRNRKGSLSQNVLAVCSFALRFIYILAGWDGSVNDTFLLADARVVDFPIPDGYYYLGDAGFPLSKHVIIPYPNKRYHLREWAASQNRPKDMEELFNLRHAQARNVVERIFGVVKRRWRILQLPMEYSMKVQAQIPAALAALHNFILENDPMYDAAADVAVAADPLIGIRMARNGQRILDDHGELATSRSVSHEESAEGKAIRDEIAAAMWRDYQQYVATRTEEERAAEERAELEEEARRMRGLYGGDDDDDDDDETMNVN